MSTIQKMSYQLTGAGTTEGEEPLFAIMVPIVFTTSFWLYTVKFLTATALASATSS